MESFYESSPEEIERYRALIDQIGIVSKRAAIGMDFDMFDRTTAAGLHLIYARIAYEQFFLRAGYAKPAKDVEEELGISHSALYKRMRVIGVKSAMVKKSPTFLDFLEKLRPLRKELTHIGIDLDEVLAAESC